MTKKNVNGAIILSCEEKSWKEVFKDSIWKGSVILFWLVTAAMWFKLVYDLF